jgi:hypothetical protein
MRNPQPQTQGWTLSPNGFDKVREVLGYLNFSSGNADPVFLQNLNVIWDLLPEGNRGVRLRDVLLDGLGQLAQEQPAFQDDTQAREVIQCALDRVLPAYRAYHSDLLFHLEEEDYEHPYFLGVVLEATLSQGGPWGDEEADQIVQGALQQLNDFVGYRPVAVLENGRKMEIYPHERFRPIPLFIDGAGVASGPYHDLIARTIELLRETPADLLHDAHFYLEHMEELGCDVRAYDHLHPVYKRTNYLFGEWDPHRIDNKGYYRRFIVRQIILDSLLDWVEHGEGRVPREERLFDAAAALCGTILMASSISGSGPGTHDSTVSLTSLLPIVARRRDEFYARMMERVSGERAQRLQREEKKTQQPFGHVRQYLNMQLAGYGARQVQHRELAHLYAMMGYADAGRRQAEEIPAASVRLETEIECTVATVHQELDRGQVERAVALINTLPELLQRGVNCGAFVDPWNILGFQGQFPLFSSREDSIPDNRIETLLELMEAIFSAFSRTLGEAAAQGLAAQREEISTRFQELAHWWDQFGSDVIEELPDVSGQESWESATQVSHALTEWRQAGEAAGDISFWRQQVEQFQTSHAYALVVDALLHAKDHVAAMGLLMQWLSQLNEVGFESPQHSIFGLLIRWMKLVTAPGAGALTNEQRSAEIRRLFAFLEANAEDWWNVPNLGHAVDRTQAMSTDDLEFGEMEEEGLDEIGEEEGDDVFGAAYDGVVFRDSAEDGNWGDTADGEDFYRDTEFEAVNREMEPHLKFLNAVGQLWQMAAASFAATMHDREAEPDAVAAASPPILDEPTIEAIVNWHRQAQRWQIDLAELMEAVWDFEISEPSGDHDANVEYDIQLQVKFYLLHQVINTLICLRNAERLLNGIIPEGIRVPRGTDQDRQLTRVYRAVIQRDTGTIRQLLPALLSRLSRNPLLYVPFENGGDPGQILRTQALQSVVRFLLRELPRLGLLRETWHLLYTAFRMERKWRPRGQAITEFDRLFTIALRSTLEALTSSALQWTPDDDADTEDLIDAIGKILDPYQWLWSEHSRTMRISAVDGLRKQEDWEELAEFIQRYGGDLFHASHLTLGNVRAILHNGVDWFLDYLEEEQDPLHPIRLLDDLDAGIIDRDTAEWCLEQVYSIIVDRFDRFLEYNTTTTQSDYGEMIYCLLEFLRLEARYDRDAWNLTPLLLVHEVLVRNGLLDAAEMWESTFEMQTADIADQHLADLRRLQRKYGMRMPTITDHLKERFVKPLAVNRILSLVKPAVADARANVKDAAAFQMLSDQIDEYLEDSWGSGIDLPEWLRTLEREVTEATHPNEGGRPGTEADLDVAPLPLSRDEFQQQARRWRDNLGSNPRTRRKRPPGHDPDDQQ